MQSVPHSQLWLPPGSPNYSSLTCQLPPASPCACAGSLTMGCALCAVRSDVLDSHVPRSNPQTTKERSWCINAPYFFFSMGQFWGVSTVSPESPVGMRPVPLAVTIMWKHLLAFLLSLSYLSLFLKTPPNKLLAPKPFSQSLFGGNLNKDRQVPVSP